MGVAAGHPNDQLLQAIGLGRLDVPTAAPDDLSVP
jgi:hypothetical protein